MITTLYDDRPAGATNRAAVRRRLLREAARRSRGSPSTTRVYAPFGDDSLLLHDVTIKNTSRTAISGSYFEYWDVNPKVQGVTQFAARLSVADVGPADAARCRSAQLPDDVDTQPLTIFASALAAPVSAYDTDTSAFFGSGTRRRAGGGRSRASSPTRSRRPRRTAPRVAGCSRSRARSRSRPGASVTLRYAYGYAHPERHRSRLLSRYRAAAQPFDRERGAVVGLAAEGRPRELATRGSRASSSGTPTRCARTRPTRSAPATTSSPRAATTSTSSARTRPSATRSSTCCR